VVLFWIEIVHMHKKLNQDQLCDAVGVDAAGIAAAGDAASGVAAAAGAWSAKFGSFSLRALRASCMRPWAAVKLSSISNTSTFHANALKLVKLINTSADVTYIFQLRMRNTCHKLGQ
jgi:hypothetical protein